MSGKQRIMIVDDSSTMRRMVGLILREAGYQVVEAEDGQQALEYLEKGACHLLVTDVNMPGIDGIDLVRRIRSNPAREALPVLMLTTESAESFKEKGERAGADAWMVKPFKPEQLLTMVRRVIP